MVDMDPSLKSKHKQALYSLDVEQRYQATLLGIGVRTGPKVEASLSRELERRKVLDRINREILPDYCK